jgi:hypothetical protein
MFQSIKSKKGLKKRGMAALCALLIATLIIPQTALATNGDESDRKILGGGALN